jgi:hypothetical protein
MSVAAHAVPLLCLCIPACGQSPPRPAAGEPAVAPPAVDTLELTAARPGIQVTVPPTGPGQSREVLVLRVARIENPGSIGFGIRASLEAARPTGAVAVPIGLVSPFPADTPGSFLLRASAAWARLGAVAPDSVRVRLELVPGGPGPLPAALRVRIGGVEWQPDPGGPKPPG